MQSKKGTAAFLLTLLLACIGLTGCSQWYYHLGETLSQHAVPQPDGDTTLKEVLAVFGPPHRLSADTNGYVFAWEYWRVREDAVGVNLSPFGLDFLSVDVARVATQGEFLLATFDAEHHLTAINLSTWNNRVGDGKALQPFGVYDVATTEDLVRGFGEVHTYGASMLRRLPTALNRESDLSSGANGIEQRATPHSMGQHSLEMR